MNHGSKRLITQLIRTRARPPCSRVTLPRTWRRYNAVFEKREWSTPLARVLAEAIRTTGPVSIAAFMRQVLTNPYGGYYTNRDGTTEVFGRKGDFITSPEITQVFGELIGIWTVAEWMAQGRKSSGIELIEVGPGKGTLMADMLRTFRNFKSFATSIETIYLVEASASLREVQKNILCGDGAAMEETEIGHQSRSKDLGVPIVWVEDIRLLPYNDKTPFIFAHEFFDALPIHAFQSVAPSPDSSAAQIMTPTGPTDLKQPRKHSETPQWRELLVALNAKAVVENIKDEPEFQLTLAKASTPSSLVIPEISERYKALKSQPGATIEISPESRTYIADFARRIGGSALSSKVPSSMTGASSTPASKKQPSGAALILDYGPSSSIPVNSLRGIRQHAKLSPFAFPGQVDVSADVDFTGLAEAALEASEGVEVHGPVEQGDYLRSLGIAERVAQLLKEVKNEEQQKTLETGWKRLVDKGPGGMGKLYKALAIVPENEGRRRPLGFGGDIVG